MSQASAGRGKNGRENAVATVVPNTPVHEYFEANPPNYDESFEIDRCGLIFSAITTGVSKLTL